MGKFWEHVEVFWNKNRGVAWVLPLSGLGLALWASLCPQSPGVSIGLLALAAGLMSIRPAMHPAEKTAWAAILVMFAILEVLAINRSDIENKSARDKQNAEFGAIAQGLKDSYALAQQHFDATMGGMNKVFDKTKEASDTAKDAVNTITGGKGFAYIELATTSLRGRKTDTLVPIMTVEGARFLHTLSAHVVDSKAFKADTSPIDPMTIMDRDAVNTNFGDYAGHGPIFQPIGITTEGKEEIDYLISFSALNGNWYEEMHYKRINGNLESAIRVLWQDVPHSGDLNKARDSVVKLKISEGYPRKNGKVEWEQPIRQP